MKLIQEVTVEGDDMVLTVRNPFTKTVIGSRRWKGAAKFIYATKEFEGKGHVFILAVPVQAGLDIKRGTGVSEAMGG